MKPNLTQSVVSFAKTSVRASNIEASSGGMGAESVEELRENIKAYFQSQNRAVTTDDYKKIVEGNVSGLDSVSVWGGQDHSTPTFGKVFVSGFIERINSTFLSLIKD